MSQLHVDQIASSLLFFYPFLNRARDLWGFQVIFNRDHRPFIRDSNHKTLLTYNCVSGVTWGSSVFVVIAGPTFLLKSSGFFDSCMFHSPPL